VRAREKKEETKTMRSTKSTLLLFAAAASLPLSAGLSFAQTPAAAPATASATTGTIHGHVQDPLQVAMAGAKVEVTTDGKTVKYTFTTDANGDYTGTGIAPGTYILILDSNGKSVDEIQNAKIVAGQNEVEDFDLSRAAYIAKMTPEEKKQMEAVQKQNAAAMKDNSVIKNLNADLAKARADIKAKNYVEADALMTKDTAAKPTASILWLELGTAQDGEKKFPEAETSLKKAISLETASPKPEQPTIGAANNSLGEALAGENKIPDAVTAYDDAAKADPTHAGMYYTNETIILSRSGQNGDATAAAADKAIAAEPNNPVPYYLKGQALIAKASVDPKTQKITAPPGCEEAYQKYLELAPDGPFAPDAKNILASMGAKVQTSYHAKRH
jgi:tetratricopeptide (TPR) repeat protein